MESLISSILLTLLLYLHEASGQLVPGSIFNPCIQYDVLFVMLSKFNPCIQYDVLFVMLRMFIFRYVYFPVYLEAQLKTFDKIFFFYHQIMLMTI